MDIYLPTNKESGTPRGFAFVTIDEANAEKAIEATNGMEFFGRNLAVSLPLPRGGEKLYSTPFSHSYGVNCILYDFLFSHFYLDLYFPISVLRGGTMSISPSPSIYNNLLTLCAARRTKLYVGNLSFYTTSDTLKELFGEFGEVFDCYLPVDNETGGFRGFGFVTMDREAAEAAINETDGCELDGRIIRVNLAQPKSQRIKEKAPEEEGDEYDP